MTHQQLTGAAVDRAPFGTLLKHWRTRRGRTQFELADHAGYSQRHVSFLESGRSKPSRAAVVILADALEVPVAERNVLLQAAGYAPLYTADPLDSSRLRFALSALHAVVESHRPFPALIVDRGWNMLSANTNALVFFQRFLPTLASGVADKPLNAMRMCIEPGELRSAIGSWPQFAATLLSQLKGEQARAVHPTLTELIELIEADPEFQRQGRDAAERVGSPVATFRLVRGDLDVELFTLLSTFNTVTDASLAELRVETFFPANEASREMLLALDAQIRTAT
jgi:transcriptional regulator with XRE-family HTH domain